MVEINAKITKIGNSYALFVPKPLIDCKVLPIGKKIRLKVLDIEKDLKTAEDLPGAMPRFLSEFSSCGVCVV